MQWDITFKVVAAVFEPTVDPVMNFVEQIVSHVLHAPRRRHPACLVKPIYWQPHTHHGCPAACRRRPRDARVCTCTHRRWRARATRRRLSGTRSRAWWVSARRPPRKNAEMRAHYTRKSKLTCSTPTLPPFHIMESHPLSGMMHANVKSSAEPLNQANNH